MQILVNKKAPPSSCPCPPPFPGLAPQLHGLVHHLLLLGPVCHLGNQENEEGRGEGGIWVCKLLNRHSRTTNSSLHDVSWFTCWPGWVLPCASPRAGLSRWAACSSGTRPSGPWPSQYWPSWFWPFPTVKTPLSSFPSPKTATVPLLHPSWLQMASHLKTALRYRLGHFQSLQLAIGSINFKATRRTGVSFELSCSWQGKTGHWYERFEP